MIASEATLAIDSADASLLGELLNVWEAKRGRNRVRTLYYDGAAPLKDFGISLPPAMRSIESALGWIAKGVHAVTDRSQFEGFVSRDGSDDPFGLSQVLDDNRFMVEFPAALVSSAVHGCSFLTVSQGDVASGEPEVLVLPRAADDSAGLWDNRRRAVRGFLSVVAVNDVGQPSEMVMYTPEKAITLTRGSQSWRVDIRRNPLGEVAVAPLIYRYELKRPFGHSRITRAAMGFADSALRTIVRAEVSAEFYSAPEYYLFGSNVQSFVGDDRWSALMGRIKALDVEDGEDKPNLHRFTGASPQPHTDQLRMWANLFADDQDLEVKFADASNPSSADAIFAAKEDLITKTREANVSWGFGAVKAMQLAVRLRDGLDATPDLRGLSAQFTDPAIVSPGARADAFSKLASAIPGFADSEVGLEAAGLGREQIIRLQADRRRSAGASRLAEIVATARGAVNGNNGQSGGSAPGGSVGTSGVGAAGSASGVGVTGP